MDCSVKDGLLPATRTSCNRKTPVSRSIKQNGEFLFTKLRRRTPITHYIPPHRRKDIANNDSYSPKKSEVTEKTRMKISDESNKLEITKDHFNREINGKAMVKQNIDRKSLITQEINRNGVITYDIRETLFLDDSTVLNSNSSAAEFDKESLRKEVLHQRSINGEYRNLLSNETEFGVTNQENIEQINNQSSIGEKILDLAKHYINLEFKHKLPDIYFNTYKEQLSTEYFNKIKFCITLDLDDLNDFLNANSHIEQKCQEENFLKGKEEYIPINSLLTQKEINKPQELELKDLHGEFHVIIYNCESFINLWGVIYDADHFGKIEELTDQMKYFFKFESKAQKEKVEENCYYALFDGSWHRVLCIKCNESTAEVLFIDRGDRDNVLIDRLYDLDPQFFKLPAQSFNMRLADLEIFTDCEGTHEMLDELLFEKVLSAVVVNKCNKEKNPFLSVQLYKTEDTKTINVNELLMKKLFKTFLRPLHYIQRGKPEHIKFLQANEIGLFINLDTTSLKYFKLLIEDVVVKYCYDGSLERQKVVRFENNKIYLVKRSRDNKFCRAKVLLFTNKYAIKVLLIDSGIVTFIDREDFFALEKLSPVLAEYPPQAIEVQLEQITILHPKIVDHLHALTSNSNELYVKFIKSKSEKNNVPIIHLYKKIHDYLISVNDAILIEHNDILECNSKSSECDFGENTPKSSECDFGENTPKSSKHNFFASTPKSNEHKFIPKSTLKSTEDNFVKTELKSAKCILDENKNVSVKTSFDENKPNSSDNHIIIKQKSSNENFDELFKNNFSVGLESIKAFEPELARSVEEIDCTKLCISGLLCPPIVPTRCFLDVHVTTASDPSCFVIQLLQSKSKELKQMEHEMRATYENYKGPTLTYRSIGVGQIYAYRCETNSKMWYRVYLLKIKDKNVASVYYCDYGFYEDVHIENLKGLQNQFYSLPYQAIWAELYGVKPVSSPFWSAEEGSRFKQLIESQNFICIVKGIKDVKTINICKAWPVTVETVYIVKLIDTSTDEDLYIADILINNGHALRKKRLK